MTGLAEAQDGAAAAFRLLGSGKLNGRVPEQALTRETYALLFSRRALPCSVDLKRDARTCSPSTVACARQFLVNIAHS